MSDADVKLDIGRELTRGLGAGADPEVGRKAAEDHAEEIEEVLKGADMVFVTAGEGGGTGTGGAPVVARIARSLGALTDRCGHPAVRVRGQAPGHSAEEGIAALREEVDTLIVIPNDRLLSISDRNVSMLDAFKQADQVLLQGVSGITDLITTPGLINLDFADVKAVMSNAGSALMGIGSARGEDRARGGGRDGGLSARCWRRASTARTACCCRSPAARTSGCSRSTRRPTLVAGGRPRRRQHHLRHRHRRRPRRRGAGHRDRRRVRRRPAEAPRGRSPRSAQAGQRPAQTQEETRAAAAAVATKREQPAEVEEKEKEPATAAAPAGQSRPESATKPAPRPMQFDDDDLDIPDFLK